jgi:ubiquinone/menaquinone biosynthesis C-methylase UbiE
MSAPYEAKQRYQDENVAAEYDAERFRGLKGWLVNTLEQRMLLRSLDGLPHGARVLDLPVGTGRLARRMAAEGYLPTGADISLAMMSVARRLAAEQHVPSDFVRGDGESLPFVDNAFDAAVCFRLLSHLPPDARVRLLREMGRVAKDRVVAVYQPHKIAAWYVLNNVVLRKRLPAYYVSAAQLVDEFAAAGLRPVRSSTLLRGAFMERAYVLERR